MRTVTTLADAPDGLHLGNAGQAKVFAKWRDVLRV